MMITERGLLPLNGIMYGIRVLRRKSKNLVPLTVPVTKSTATIPLEDSAAMALTRWPLTPTLTDDVGHATSDTRPSRFSV